ncbi:MAG TPA: hypothetical protein VHN12_12400 [Geobacteraceae bacterium]|nr:hypothetical protein [Geobacteraceae bacterium]
MNRQKMVLALLLVILAISLAYSLLRRPQQRTLDKMKYTPGLKADPARIPGRSQDGKKLRLDLLDRELPRFSGFRRNIFRPFFSDEMHLPPVAARPVLPVTPPPPAPTPQPVVKSPAQIAMEEVGRFSFLGYLQKGNLRTIFLSKENEIILVRKGDKIAGKYEVAAISDEVLTINLLQGGEQIVIPLQQNRALARGPVPGAGRPPAGL